MAIAIPITKNKWIENFARFGYCAKGVVYCLLGVLAVIAAFGSGSAKDTGKTDVFKLILEQPLGKFLLFVVALGLLGYVMWRFIEAIKDPHNDGKNAKGMMKRIGYGISAIIYLGLSIYAFTMVFNGSSSDSGGNSKQSIVDKILDLSYGQWLIGIIAGLIVAKGIYEIYKAVSGKYKKDLQEDRINPSYRKLLVKSGLAGYIARGIVWGIIGFLFFRAAINANPSEVGGTEKAFGLLESDFGPYVMGIVAIGLICYGIFKILEGLYKRLDV